MAPRSTTPISPVLGIELRSRLGTLPLFAKIAEKIKIAFFSGNLFQEWIGTNYSAHYYHTAVINDQSHVCQAIETANRHSSGTTIVLLLV